MDTLKPSFLSKKTKTEINELHKAIFFTRIPLGGHYRYKDLFQIYPCNLENMPTSVFQRHHPNIIEYRITEEEIIDVPTEFEGLQELFNRTATTLAKQDSILALLSTFTNNLFFRYHEVTGMWGIPMPKGVPDEEANNWPSQWCMRMYHFPDLPRQMTIERFSDQQYPDIPRIDHVKFYTYDPNLDFDSRETVIFPASIDKLFDAYYSLDLTTSKYVEAASSYTLSAIELKDTRKTLSILSSFTAMETMVNLEFKDSKIEKCTDCGQLKYSVARKFREYLLKYVGNTEKNKKKFNSYYSLRSKIVHTGERLKTETLFADIEKEEEEKEQLTRIEILQIGKLAITNWLLINGK
jgi:hypothetical protein